MEGNKLLTLLVTVTVGIIFTGALLAPVIEDVSATEKTFVNEGLFNYGIFEPNDTYTLEFDSSDGSIEVNGTVVTPIPGISLTQYASYSVLSADNVILRYGSNNTGYYLQILGSDSGGNTVAAGGVTVSATISDDTISVTYVNSQDVSTTKTFNFTEMYAIVPTEDEAVLKASSSQVYIKGDSPLYAGGVTTVTAWSNVIHFEGNYDDGIVITSPSLPDATYSNIVWNIEEVEGYVDLYKLTSIEFDITNNDTTVHATYSYFAVPTEVTAEISQHLDAGEIAILAAIPLMAIAALVLLVVRYFVAGRD